MFAVQRRTAPPAEGQAPGTVVDANPMTPGLAGGPQTTTPEQQSAVIRPWCGIWVPYVMVVVGLTKMSVMPPDVGPYLTVATGERLPQVPAYFTVESLSGSFSGGVSACVDGGVVRTWYLDGAVEGRPQYTDGSSRRFRWNSSLFNRSVMAGHPSQLDTHGIYIT